MSDLAITTADIDSGVARLRDAAVAVTDAVCFAPGVTGSDLVAAALGDADSIVRRVADALSGTADSAATDGELISATLDETDLALAGGTP